MRSRAKAYLWSAVTVVVLAGCGSASAPGIGAPPQVPSAVGPAGAPLPPEVVSPQPPQAAAQALSTATNCEQFRAQGQSYRAAVGYWLEQGTPPVMDADGNGVPCESDYSAADVSSYWGDDGPRSADPGDLDCGDFESQRIAQAVLDKTAGDPYELDEDGNGSACDTP